MVVRHVVLSAALACGVARAEGLSAALTLASDGVWRGYSRSQGGATWALDLTWRSDGGWFAAVGLLDRRAGSATGRWEWTLMAGQRWLVGPDWVLSASVLRYEHGGGPRRIDAEYTDLNLGLDWRGRAHALLSLSPDTHSGGRSGWVRTLEAGWHENLPWRLALDAGIGWQHSFGAPAYGYGSVGLSWSLGDWRVSGTRIASRAVSSGAYPASTQPSRWVLSVVLSH
jgi:hypothetical protein